MIRPELPPYSQTPIAIIRMETAAGESAFRDDDPSIAGKKFAEHLAKRFEIGFETRDLIAQAFSEIAAAHPRQIKQRMPRSLPIIDRMKALRDMPRELAECFLDGETAEISSRRIFQLCKKARSEPSLGRALDKQLQSPGRKVQYAHFQIPTAARPLSELIKKAFDAIGVKAVLELTPYRYDYVHILTFSMRPNNAFTAMSKKLSASEHPFALGHYSTMLSPTAWAIIRGISFYGFGNTGVETGNAACAKRSGTTSLRKLKRYWSEAAETLFYYKNSTAPHGYDDFAAIPFPPSAEDLREIEAYTDIVWPDRFTADHQRGIANIIKGCLELQHRRTKALPDPLKETA